MITVTTIVTITATGIEMQATTAPVKTGAMITARIGTEETITAMITEADVLTNGTITVAMAALICRANQAEAKAVHRKTTIVVTVDLTDQTNPAEVKADHRKMTTAEAVTITALTLQAMLPAGAA